MVVAEVEELSSAKLRAASRSGMVSLVPDRMFVKERAACKSSGVRGDVVMVVLGMEVLSCDRLRAASRSQIVKAVPDWMLIRERAACKSSSVRSSVVVVVVAVGDVVVMMLLCFE